MTRFFGLTGSIGMGKSITADMFRQHGIPVHDADATVHRLYEGEAVLLIEAAFPGTTRDGQVDRNLLSGQVVGNEPNMKRLEAIVHPLVKREEQAFRDSVKEGSYGLAILDNPLLFEMNSENQVDGIVVVTAPASVQRERVLARPGMTVEKFEAILNRQIPDEIKRQKADFIIDTSLGLIAAEREVVNIINTITRGDWQTEDYLDA